MTELSAEPYLEHARRGRNAWWRYLLAALVALGLAFVLGVVTVAVLLYSHAVSTQTLTGLQSPTQPVNFFLGNGVAFAIILAGFVAGARLLQGKRFTDVVGAWSWRLVGAGAGVWTACLVLSTLADFAIAPAGFGVTVSPATLTLALAAAVGLGVQTFAEEWIFRGWLTQGLLLATKRPLPAAILAGLIFGAVHIPNGWPQAAGATAFGIATSLLAIRLGGIAFTWGLHVLNNLFGAVVVVSGGDVFRGSPGVFTQTTPQLMWWDVGAELVALALVLWLVLRRPPTPDVARTFS
jgi:membrane protease YdiL (CAAX protease family)